MEQRIKRTLLNYQPKASSKYSTKTLPSFFQKRRLVLSRSCQDSDIMYSSSHMTMMATKNSTFVTPIVSILNKLGIDRAD